MDFQDLPSTSTAENSFMFLRLESLMRRSDSVAARHAAYVSYCFSSSRTKRVGIFSLRVSASFLLFCAFSVILDLGLGLGGAGTDMTGSGSGSTGGVDTAMGSGSGCGSTFGSSTTFSTTTGVCLTTGAGAGTGAGGIAGCCAMLLDEDLFLRFFFLGGPATEAEEAPNSALEVGTLGIAGLLLVLVSPPLIPTRIRGLKALPPDCLSRLYMLASVDDTLQSARRATKAHRP